MCVADSIRFKSDRPIDRAPFRPCRAAARALASPRTGGFKMECQLAPVPAPPLDFVATPFLDYRYNAFRPLPSDTIFWIDPKKLLSPWLAKSTIVRAEEENTPGRLVSGHESPKV